MKYNIAIFLLILFVSMCFIPKRKVILKIDNREHIMYKGENVVYHYFENVCVGENIIHNINLISSSLKVSSFKISSPEIGLTYNNRLITETSYFEAVRDSFNLTLNYQPKFSKTPVYLISFIINDQYNVKLYLTNTTSYVEFDDTNETFKEQVISRKSNCLDSLIVFFPEVFSDAYIFNHSKTMDKHYNFDRGRFCRINFSNYPNDIYFVKLMGLYSPYYCKIVIVD
jgi:hypothetical protein